jgi:cytochrome P450
VRRDEALRILRDPEHFTVDDPRFSTACVVGPSMLSTEGAEHDRHRAPFARAYRREAIAGLEPWVRAQAHALVDAFPDGEAELSSQYAAPLAATVMARMLGIEAVPVADVLRWYRSIVSATVGDAPLEEGRAAFAELRAAMALAPAGELSADEVASNAGVLLFGGIETTEGMIANLVWHYLTEPAARDGAIEDVVEESLRLEPAAAQVDRYAGDEFVAVRLDEANRDPAAFDDPHSFRPGRPTAHVSFAAGPHTCLGMHLARLEARVALAVLLERCEGLELAGANAPGGDVFRKPVDLRVRFRGKP